MDEQGPAVRELIVDPGDRIGQDGLVGHRHVRDEELAMGDVVGVVEGEVGGSFRPRIQHGRDPELEEHLVVAPIRRRSAQPESRLDLREPGMAEESLVREPDRRIQAVERSVEGGQAGSWVRGRQRTEPRA